MDRIFEFISLFPEYRKAPWLFISSETRQARLRRLQNGLVGCLPEGLRREHDIDPSKISNLDKHTAGPFWDEDGGGGEILTAHRRVYLDASDATLN